jgi:carbamoyl-phosphate synthase large subunit
MKILLTGCGAPGAPAIIKLLQGARHHVTGTDINPNASGKWLCDEFFIDRYCYVDQFYLELKREMNRFDINQYPIDDLHKFDLVLPLVTSQLEFWSKLEQRKIIISDHKSLIQMNSKLELMNACDRLGIDRAFYTTSDLCMKPTNSNGGRGFERIDNPENKLIMEYLPGREWSVDCLADNRKAIAIIPRTRDKIKAAISVETTVTFNEKIINDCKKIIESFNLFGPIGFQFKEDKNGTPKIIECNPRCQGSMCITGYAGFDIINNAVKLAAGQRLNEPDIKWGTKMIRYWNEIYV